MKWTRARITPLADAPKDALVDEATKSADLPPPRPSLVPEVVTSGESKE